jgi:hypothetical protein
VSEPTEGQQDFLNVLRRNVAITRSLDEGHQRVADSVAAAMPDGFGSGVAMVLGNAQRNLQQIAEAQAAIALAYEGMIAAGGPENSRAYVEYEAECCRINALLPRGDLI